MKEINISHLAYLLKQAKKNNQPQPIFFLGAGASRSGNIPLASEMIIQILNDYSDNPFIKDLSKENRTYAKLMDCLLPDQRDELLKKYINEAKINVTHIYLAQLLKEGYVDYVLTVNFDNLMLRALALLNIFPSTYDMAILKDFTTTTFKEKSIVYLHGQNHGLWLLNTPEEMKKVKNTVPRIFDTIKNKRPWIFIGYSGEDAIFEHIKNLGRYNNGLYWVTYNNINPNESVQNFLSESNTNAFIIKGYDSDSFILKLNNELGLGQPSIVNKPFTALKEMLNEIIDIDDKDYFKGVKERLIISKKQVEDAIKQFELGEIESLNDIKENKINLLKKEVINIIINENYKEEEITNIEKRIKNISDENLQELLSGLYNDWGIELGSKAKLKNGEETEILIYQAIEKYEKAIEINPNNYDAYNNWGVILGNLSELKNNNEAEQLLLLAIEKFKNAIDIIPNYEYALYNWGTFLGNIAKLKKDNEAEQLLLLAIEKLQKAIDIKPNNDDAYNNWGAFLGALSNIKIGYEAEQLLYLAIEKYEKAIEINPSNDNTYYNWGSTLEDLAKLKDKNEAEQLLYLAIEKYEKAIDINSNNNDAYNNWGSTLFDISKLKDKNEAEQLLYLAIEKYEKAIDIKSNDNDAYNNWGSTLFEIAKLKDKNEAEQLLYLAIEKCKKAIDINPNDYGAYNNWGNAIGYLTELKDQNEVEQLLLLAIQKYEKAIDINPNEYNAYNNWGTSLGDLAKLKDRNEAEQLLLLAIQKYEKAIDINPNDYAAYNNWGTSLVNLGKLKVGVETDRLYQLAFELCKKASDLSGKNYNLACIYALKGVIKDALYYLELSLKNQEITTTYVEQDEDWCKLLNNKDFITIINKYNK